MPLSSDSCSPRTEMSVAACRYAGRFNPDALSLLQHACKNLKSDNNVFHIQFNYTYVSGLPILNVILKLVWPIASTPQFMTLASEGQFFLLCDLQGNKCESNVTIISVSGDDFIKTGSN